MTYKMTIYKELCVHTISRLMLPSIMAAATSSESPRVSIYCLKAAGSFSKSLTFTERAEYKTFRHNCCKHVLIIPSPLNGLQIVYYSSHHLLLEFISN